MKAVKDAARVSGNRRSHDGGKPKAVHVKRLHGKPNRQIGLEHIQRQTEKSPAYAAGRKNIGSSRILVGRVYTDVFMQKQPWYMLAVQHTSGKKSEDDSQKP